MAKAPEIKDREAITDHICTVMHDQYRDTSIDVLLTHPVDAIEMAIEVGARAGRINKAAAKEWRRKLKDLRLSDVPSATGTIDTVNEILRAAIAARKRGDLKRDRV